MWRARTLDFPPRPAPASVPGVIRLHLLDLVSHDGQAVGKLVHLDPHLGDGVHVIGRRAFPVGAVTHSDGFLKVLRGR